MDPRALADALMGKGLEQYTRPWMERPEYKPPTDPYKAPWAYPEWTARNGELRAPAERPKDWSAPIAEAISPTMGGYGLGSGAATAYRHGQEGDWRGAAGEAALLAAGAIMPGPKAAPKQGIRAYHGSPHDFDRFSMDKIGSGEGAQAYGHGLYFAESEGVARNYRDTLTPEARLNGRPIFQDDLAEIPEATSNAIGWDRMLDRVKQLGSVAAVRSEVDAAHGNSIGGVAKSRFIRALDDMERLGLEPATGRIYEVRINADPADFLDWDKPLSQQSEKVRSGLSDVSGYFENNPTTAEAVRKLEMDWGGRSMAPAEWEARGIPGIKYLDQGSRSEGAGTRNYVVFRDDIIDVVRKYGIAAAASMYGMDAVQNVMLADKLQEPVQ